MHPRDGEDAPVPGAVRALAGGQPLRLVWLHHAGGRTWQVGTGPRRRFAKWAPAGGPVDLAREAVRLAWAVAWTPVPRVLGSGADAHGSWLLTAGLPGRSAADPRWAGDPAVAVPAVGAALRALHDALPVPGCPFSWSVADRMADARRRSSLRLVDPAQWQAEHRSLTVPAALALAADVPDVDRLVVCHGDAAVPNTLLDEHGRWTGHVDLGLLGTADRWADLAVATWSSRWTHGPGWEERLLEAYGVEPDPDRTRYYRLLWDLTSGA
ncbi:aminoglycoside 3'-phosphotransferase [Quadrisphaera sp. DSM 44207]|uniref:aminoglycoside 3'-phosphotransferase n=1 Tax=Quadrisphaera sp. DSM 44207 TaxID=1881057 RepID=UPI000883154E|nr:aminoglycoside 3'-phosphotransferase [Quadrisphaera sp. DSM 44207]SDQ15783.1 kanamycin kinase [Quadrisphaera sp. DSM 44207]